MIDDDERAADHHQEDGNRDMAPTEPQPAEGADDLPPRQPGSPKG